MGHSGSHVSIISVERMSGQTVELHSFGDLSSPREQQEKRSWTKKRLQGWDNLDLLQVKTVRDNGLVIQTKNGLDGFAHLDGFCLMGGRFVHQITTLFLYYLQFLMVSVPGLLRFDGWLFGLQATRGKCVSNHPLTLGLGPCNK